AARNAHRVPALQPDRCWLLFGRQRDLPGNVEPVAARWRCSRGALMPRGAELTGQGSHAPIEPNSLKGEKGYMTHVIRAVLLAVVMVLAGTAFAAEGQKIRIGTEGTYRPFSYFDASGKLTGFEVELVDAICAKIKADCEWVTMDLDGMVPALQEKKIDGI